MAELCSSLGATLANSDWPAMQAGIDKCHGTGMCGPDEMVKYVCQVDAVIFKKLGITIKQLASAMAKVVEMFDEGINGDLQFQLDKTNPLGDIIISNAFDLREWSMRFWTCHNVRVLPEVDEYKIMMVCWNGAQTCPFQQEDNKRYNGYKYGSYDYYIVSPDGKSLFFNSLLIHMMAVHNFCEGTQRRDGKTNVWRVDPEMAYECLKPIVDAMPVEGDAALLQKYIYDDEK